MKALHISDLHIDITAKRLGRLIVKDGVNLVHEDRVNLIKTAITKGLDEKVDSIFITGDIFNKDQPYPKDYRVMVDIIQMIPSSITIYIIPGNHDEPTQRGFGLEPLQGIWKNVVIAEEVKTFHCEYPIILAPWNSKLDVIKEHIAACPSPPILLYHAGVWSDLASWVEVEGEQGNVYINDLIKLGCKAICLGHHHGQAELANKIWYAGALDDFGFGDESQAKGYLIWDFETDKVTPYSLKGSTGVFKTFTVEEFLDPSLTEFDGYVRIKGIADEKERVQVAKKLVEFKCIDYIQRLEHKHVTKTITPLKGDNDEERLKDYLVRKKYENIDELLELDKQLQQKDKT